MHPLLQKVAQYIQENELLRGKDTVVVAVSGGADSVALLDILSSLGGLRLVVAHLNHLLRGNDSDCDAAFVEGLAAHYGLPLESRSIDVSRFSNEKRLSLEEGGREARYAWFDEVAAKYGARAVALGHHADDQAETVLMRLLRGAGTSGLSGISPLSAGRYIRPLLCARRVEIEEYLKNRNLSFRTDGSNTDTRFLRNRVRHELLPFLETFNPSIRDRLVGTAEILSADEALLEDITEKAFERLASATGTRIAVDLHALRTELPGLRLRIYRGAVRTAKGDLAHISLKHLRQIDELAFSLKANSSITLPGNMTVAKHYQALHFAPASELAAGEALELVIEAPGTYPLPGGELLSVTRTEAPLNWKNQDPGKAYFDLDAVPFPWVVRTFRDGDRFTPLGMTGSKKVKDFFIDMKIPLSIRRKVPLVASNGTIIWIAGFRLAEQARVRVGTRNVVLAETIDDER
jgi:tRNA(Ile)-lysidine synthase